MRKGNEGARSDWETGLQQCGKLKIERIGPRLQCHLTGAEPCLAGC